MALQMDLKHDSGLEIENAYWKITSVAGGKEYLYIRCEVFLSKEAAEGRKQPITHIAQAFRPSVEEGSENFIKQAYEYLKTLPEFEGAIDC